MERGLSLSKIFQFFFADISSFQDSFFPDMFRLVLFIQASNIAVNLFMHLCESYRCFYKSILMITFRLMRLVQVLKFALSEEELPDWLLHRNWLLVGSQTSKCSNQIVK